MKLTEKKCVPCEGGVEPLKHDEVGMYLKLVDPAWEFREEKMIFREFRFVNFLQTMDFVNRVAEIAEKEGHHPNMYIGYGFCQVELWTHAIDGLSENDFILAAKIDTL